MIFIHSANNELRGSYFSAWKGNQLSPPTSICTLGSNSEHFKREQVTGDRWVSSVMRKQLQLQLQHCNSNKSLLRSCRQTNQKKSLWNTQRPLN